MKFLYKKQYLKRFDSYPKQFQELVLETDCQIKTYIEKQIAPFGLGIKKIGPKTYETRVNDQIRIVWVKEEGFISFVLLGSHDEVRRFIKNF